MKERIQIQFGRESPLDQPEGEGERERGLHQSPGIEGGFDPDSCCSLNPRTRRIVFYISSLLHVLEVLHS